MKARIVKMVFTAFAAALFLMAQVGCLSGLKLRLGCDDGPENRKKLEAPLEGAGPRYDYGVAITYNIPLEIFTPEAPKETDD